MHDTTARTVSLVSVLALNKPDPGVAGISGFGIVIREHSGVARHHYTSSSIHGKFYVLDGLECGFAFVGNTGCVGFLLNRAPCTDLNTDHWEEGFSMRGGFTLRLVGRIYQIDNACTN